MFVCGGLRGGILLGDMFVSEESPTEAGMTRAEATIALGEVIDLAAPAWQRWLRDAGLAEEASKALRDLPATRLEADKFRARTALLERRATAAETRAELAETETRQARNTVEDAASSTATAHKLVSEHVVPQDATLMKRA